MGIRGGGAPWRPGMDRMGADGRVEERPAPPPRAPAAPSTAEIAGWQGKARRQAPAQDGDEERCDDLIAAWSSDVDWSVTE